jgi:predicted DNA-binding protein (MmcQ/YjbR family)
MVLMVLMARRGDRRNNRCMAKARRGKKKAKVAKSGGSRSAKARGGPLAAFCRTLPGTTEDIKWGDDLIFSIGKKMYAGFGLEDPEQYGFKCSEEDFWRLIQREGIIPAPYAARFHWVAVKKRGALPAGEAKVMLKKAYGIVLAGLPKRTQEAVLAGAGSGRG